MSPRDQCPESTADDPPVFIPHAASSSLYYVVLPSIDIIPTPLPPPSPPPPGMLAASYFYMAVWIVNGETLTRRIRQAYLKSALRQNVGYWDDLGAGEVTTKLTYDMNVLQRGVSEKVPMVTQYTAQFFAGFVVAFIKWVVFCFLSGRGVREKTA